MVEVVGRVWSEWRALSEQSGKPTIELLFTSELEPMDAQSRLRAVLGGVVDRFQVDPRTVPAGVDEPMVGAWSIAPVPGGVMIVVGPKADFFEPMLRALVQDLDACGLDGRMDLFERPAVPEVPFHVDLVTARMRVEGERYGYHRDSWSSSLIALDALIAAGVDWCLDSPSDLGVTVTSGSLPTRLVSRDEDPVQAVHGALSRRGFGHAVLRSVSTASFRSLSVHAGLGQIALTESCTAGWERSVASLSAWISKNAASIAYAHIKGGTDLIAAEACGPDPFAELSHPPDADAYEDTYAPDVYGIQLLGPRFADRLHLNDDWRQSPLADGKILLEATALDSWFDHPASTDSPRPAGREPPAILAPAREEFADLIFDDELASRRRAWLGEHQPKVKLPDSLVTKLDTFPASYNATRSVALTLDDGSSSTTAS